MKYPRETIEIYAAEHSFALGRHLVEVKDDACTRGKSDKNRIITITFCDSDEFTCTDGYCIPMDKRCDRINHCPDRSDESNCEILSLGEGYIADYEPVTVDVNYDIVKVPIHVSVDILTILGLSEIDGIFSVEFELFLTWFDQRIVFKNLKPFSELNKLTEIDKKSVWKPIIVFDNTESKNVTVTDNRIIATVNKMGDPTFSPITDPVETYFYDGKDNPITFSRKYAVDFLCEYNLAWYPFDIQKCSLEFKPDGSSGEYIHLIRDKFRYLGEEELSVYFIQGHEYNRVDAENFVQGNLI